MPSNRHVSVTPDHSRIAFLRGNVRSEIWMIDNIPWSSALRSLYPLSCELRAGGIALDLADADGRLHMTGCPPLQPTKCHKSLYRFGKDT